MCPYSFSRLNKFWTWAVCWLKNPHRSKFGIIPPEFSLERTYTERKFNNEAEQHEEVEKTQRFVLVPQAISIDTDLVYGERNWDMLIFNAFEVHNKETYVLVNDTTYSGSFQVKVTKPENANLLYDYTISVGDQVTRPVMDSSVEILPKIDVGERVEIVITYSTKGMDIYKYNLSAYQNSVIQDLDAKIKLNTQEYNIYREGLPHIQDFASDGSATLHFKTVDFSTT